MRIPSGKTDQVLFFVAYDSSDHTTRKTGLSSFTVYRSRNGGTATAYTTPTVTELSSSNMPGVYALLIDEDTTVASGSDSEEYCVHITATGMDPVSRTCELYRRDTTSGNTASVDSSGRVDAAKVGGNTSIVATVKAIGRGTVTSGGSTTSVPTSALTLAGSAATGVVADQFKGRTVLFDGDTTTAGLRGASATISASSASNTPTLTVGALPATPASGDAFSIV
jgi:hypothetical protein